MPSSRRSLKIAAPCRSHGTIIDSDLLLDAALAASPSPVCPSLFAHPFCNDSSQLAMKHELKRIEATLNQLQAQTPSMPELPTSLLLPSVPPLAPPANPCPEQAISFEVQPRSLPSDPETPPLAPKLSQAAELQTAEQSARDRTDLETFPTLPLVDSMGFTTHRNIANPQLAMNLLRELETMVQGWQDSLQQVMQQIQALYDEGPIVDGWLESYTQEGEALISLRHADVDCLLDYVEKHWAEIQSPDSAANPMAADIAAGYRLCGLNEDGQFWFRHCPAEQVPVVSLAIARYQRLRQLLQQKQQLEARLGQLAEALIEVHHQGKA